MRTLATSAPLLVAATLFGCPSSGGPAGEGTATPPAELPAVPDAGRVAAALEVALGRGDVEGLVAGAPRAPSGGTTPCGPRTWPSPGALVYVPDIVDPRGPSVEPIAPVEIAFSGCAITPPLSIAPDATATIALSTIDPVRHEAVVTPIRLEGGSGGAARRVPMPLEGQRFLLEQRGPGVLQVSCSHHERERAWIVLPAHRHHALTDHEGRFRLHDVPAGRHRLRAWSPDGRRAEGEALVVPNVTVSVNLTLP
jgi:hypothetical protein